MKKRVMMGAITSTMFLTASLVTQPVIAKGLVTNVDQTAITIPTSPVVSGNQGSAIVATAQTYLGVPYVWGGTSPAGFDCSGLVQYVYGLHGIDLPRTTADQQLMGQTIPLDQAQAGDLYFFIEAGATSSYHVAIATGEGYFIHAPQPGDVVSYSHVDYFSPQLAIRLK